VHHRDVTRKKTSTIPENMNFYGYQGRPYRSLWYELRDLQRVSCQHPGYKKERYPDVLLPGVPAEKQTMCVFKKRCRLLTEGKVNFCYECPDFPCDRLTAIDKRYQERYHMSMIDNQVLIRDHGIEAFLKKEEEKWRCPDCSGTICCYNDICFDCGIDRLKAKKEMYRW